MKYLLHLHMSTMRLVLLIFFFLAVLPAAGESTSTQPMPRLALRYLLESKKDHGPRKKPPRQKTDSLVLEVRVELPDGWHINSAETYDSLLVPTRIEANAQGLKFGVARFPESEMVYSPAMGEKLPLYSGTFKVEIPVQGDEGKLVSGMRLPPTRATLIYQACNNSMCLPVKSVTVELPSGGVGL